MECKYCETVNSDDAAYCKNCGKRIDGKKICPACGSVIDEDSVYCNACGARVDGKVVCKNCGTVHEGAYCPQCGSKNRAVGAQVKERVNGAPSQAAVNASRIINYVSLALVIAFAVLSIIFVCFTGVTMGSQEGESISLGIFDYFGKEFTEVKDTLSEMNVEASPAYKASLYTPAVLGLISVIISLVGTVAFAIKGAVTAILNLVRKNGKNATVWALLSFVCYMFGVGMMMSINAASVSASSSGASVSTNVEFNGATIAGIVLCTLMGAGSVGCDTTVYFMKEKLAAFKIVRRVLAVVVAVGAVVAVAMFSSPVVTWINRYTRSDYYETVTVKTNTGLGLLGLLTLYVTINGYQFDNNSQSASKDLNMIEACTILGQVCIFIAIVAALLLIVTVLSKAGKKNSCLSVISSSVFLAATLIVLITTVLAGNKFLSAESLQSNSGKNDMSYAPVIVAFVFAVLTFAGNICRVVFGGKNKEELEECSAELAE